MLLLCKNFVRIVAISLSGMIAAHFLYIFLATFYTLYLEEHRLLNIKNFPEKYWHGIGRAFITSRLHPKNENILFVGSSFTWGYAWQEDAIYTYKIQKNIKANKNIVNISRLGSTLEWKLKILMQLYNMKVRVKTLIIEINSPNARDDLQKIGMPIKLNSEKSSSVSLPIPYFDFFLENPLGISVFSMVFNQYNYFKADREKINIAPLPGNYYMTLDFLNDNEHVIERYLQYYSRYGNLISDEVYIFISPIAYEAVSDTGHNEKEVRETYNILYNICKKQVKVICVDTYQFDNSKYFENVTHLNIKGHQAFSEFLLRNIDF